MKKSFLFLSLIASISLFSQGGINFETTSFQEILNKAKQEKKLVFLDAYASWCGPCKMMERNVFTNQAVAEYYNSSFINARIDMEKGEGRSIAQKYGIRSYPTLIFLNGEGEVVSKELGYLDSDQFLSFAKDSNKPNNINSNLKEQFAKGERDPKFLINFVNLYANTEPELAKKASEEYFKNKKDNTVSPEEVNLLLNFTQSLQDPNYQYFVKLKPEIIKLFSEQNYNQFNNHLKLMDVFKHSIDEKTKMINDQYFITETSQFMPQEDVKISLELIKLNYYPSVGMYDEYEKVALTAYEVADGKAANELLKAAYVFNEHVKNVASLKKAAMWAEKAMLQQDNFVTSNILAQLYDKLGRKDEAKMMAKSAVQFAESEGQDASKAKDILNKK